jgi:phosphoglycolate phosphatase
MSAVQERSLAATVAPIRVLLLDFDGPICDIFAGYPAPKIAEELRDLIAARGHAVAPVLAGEQDPLQVLRVVARLYADDVTEEVADAFRAAELAAVETAQPTPGAADVLEAAISTGRLLSVVSNNSREAVTKYLDARGLSRYFERVVGRYDGMSPALLKPSPHLVELAVVGLDIALETTALVGDSTTDIEAAQAARMLSVGYANKTGKRRAFAEGGATAVIDSMADLATALREAPYDGEATPG